MTTIKRIAKNTMVLLISQIISYILAFFYMIYIARYLGPDGFGILSFALAFAGVFSIFADMGLNTLTVREIARDKSLTGKYFINVLSMKIILSILTFGIIIISINALNYSQETIYTVYLVALSVILTAIAGIFNSIFQAHEEMEFQSIGLVINSILMFIGVFLIIYNGLGILGFAFIYVISSFISLLFVFIAYIWRFSLENTGFNWSFWIPTLKNALPFGLSGVFSTVYVWIDTVILSFIQGNDAVGLYSAAYRIIMLLLFVQTFSSISIFPVMSKYFISSPNSLKKTVEKYFKFMLIFSIPLGVIVMLLSDKIILFIFGPQYEGSIIALQILIWATIITFMYTAFVQMFLSTNKQFTITKITGFCMIFNIALNLILIPKYSYIGASIVTVLTEFIILALVFKISADTEFGISKKQFKLIVKVAVASLSTGLFIVYFKEINIYLLVLSAIILYVAIIFLLRCVDKEDINLIMKIFND